MGKVAILNAAWTEKVLLFLETKWTREALLCEIIVLSGTKVKPVALCFEAIARWELIVQIRDRITVEAWVAILKLNGLGVVAQQ